MGLRGSIFHSQKRVGGAGFVNGGRRNEGKPIEITIGLHRSISVLSVSSTPSGYRIPKAPLIYPIANGGMAGRLSAVFDVNSSIIGDGYMLGSSIITFTLSATGDLLASINGSETVTFTVLCDILGYGYMAGNADISAQPTAADIAGEFFATMVDGTFTMRDVLKILAAVAAGKTNITDLGLGNAVVEFRDLSDTKEVVTAEMTGSERTNVTLDL